MTNTCPTLRQAGLTLCMVAWLAFSLVYMQALLADAAIADEVIADESIDVVMQYEWRLVRDLNDIQVYMKHRDESRIKSFKAKTSMKAPDPYSLAAVIEDFENAPEWMHMMSEVTELNRHADNLRDVRLQTRLPWPVNDRDAVVKAVVNQDPQTYDIEIQMIQNDNLLPEYPGYIRMPEIQGVIRAKMLSNQRMAFEMEFLMDPGGYIPPWLSNVILKDISYHTLRKLKGVLLKEEYQNKKSVYEHWLSMPENYYEDSYAHPSEKKSKVTEFPIIRNTDFIPQ